MIASISGQKRWKMVTENFRLDFSKTSTFLKFSLSYMKTRVYFNTKTHIRWVWTTICASKNGDSKLSVSALFLYIELQILVTFRKFMISSHSGHLMTSFLLHSYFIQLSFRKYIFYAKNEFRDFEAADRCDIYIYIYHTGYFNFI